VQRIRDRGDPLTRADLAISGSDLQALGAKGPQVGQVLATLLNQVLEEPALNTRERLLERARGLLQ
jgi:tRNA nucleotidyltransferase (CCA-adding enzyme)